MLISLFADASWCPETWAGGWGVWVKSERGQRSQGGIIKKRYSSSTEAEAAAIGNALYYSLFWGLAFPGDELLIQSDCQAVLGVLEGRYRAKHAGVVDVSLYMKRMRAEHALKIRYRHVPGHTSGKKPRLWVNNLCDTLAKDAMRAHRDFLRQREDFGLAR